MHLACTDNNADFRMAGVGSTIDVSPFVGESRPADAATAAAIAEEWDQTFTTSGFAQIVGHGIDPALVAGVTIVVGDRYMDLSPPIQLKKLQSHLSTV